MSEELNINQQNVSKIENRTDLKLSTLRSYIESLCGKLNITAHLPGHKAVSLNGIERE